MAQFWEDFAGMTAGQLPTGFTERLVSYGWQVADDAEATQGKVVNFANAGDGSIGLLSWDAVDGDANRNNAELQMRFRFNTLTEGKVGLFARGSGSAGSQNAYYGDVFDTSDVGLNKWVSGAFTALTTRTSLGFTFATGTWYRMRFRVNGSDLFVKVWEDGSAEPGTWTVTDTDADISAPGWVGIGSYEELSDIDIDWVSAGTNGETAPDSAPASDSTTPTHTTDGTLTKDEILHDRFTLGFDPSEDETTADADMTYKLFTSATNNLDTDVSTVEANGTEQNSAVGNLSELSSGDISADFDPGDTLWANVVAYDEAGNGVIYDQVEVTLQKVYGNVKDLGVNDPEAVIRIETVPEDTDPTTQPTPVENIQADANGDFWMTQEYDPSLHYLISTGYWETQQSATADGGTLSTLNDVGAFSAGEYDGGGYAVRTTGGTGSGQTRKIDTNTADDLNVVPDWGVIPDGTTEYEVVQWQSAGSQIILRTQLPST